MKVKTAELRGAALDWAVAAARDLSFGLSCGQIYLPNSCGDFVREYSPSSNWVHGGPLIDKFLPALCPIQGGGWQAEMDSPTLGDDYFTHVLPGETALIAAMRAIVMAKLGGEAGVPDELAAPQ